MELEVLFNQRKGDVRFNTSYPLSPTDWEPYKVESELDYSDCNKLSFYIHIPFCCQLCRFCEYTRTLVPSVEIQKEYLKAIRHDIEQFLDLYPSITLAGFDIGGGTPTSLDEECFKYLMELYNDVVKRIPVTEGFEPSIEGTFQTLTPQKLTLIHQVGIRRISLGIQSSVNHVQKSNGRVNPDITSMAETIQWIHAIGIRKVNIDFMYGLKGQTLSDIKNDIVAIRYLSPEQVTLYELRTNMLENKEELHKEQLMECYQKLYNGLAAQGYYARFGQNTFSKDKHDLGLSSYLRHRMIDFLPYKGFGLSAQSMSPDGISYNIGKRRNHIKQLLFRNSFSVEDTYQLPKLELFSKYMAVSAYYGQISLEKANRILGQNFADYFKKEIEFCVQQGYITINTNHLTITPKGFRYYGAVFSLFYEKE